MLYQTPIISNYINSNIKSTFTLYNYLFKNKNIYKSIYSLFLLIGFIYDTINLILFTIIFQVLNMPFIQSHLMPSVM